MLAGSDGFARGDASAYVTGVRLAATNVAPVSASIPIAALATKTGTANLRIRLKMTSAYGDRAGDGRGGVRAHTDARGWNEKMGESCLAPASGGRTAVALCLTSTSMLFGLDLDVLVGESHSSDERDPGDRLSLQPAGAGPVAAPII